MSTVDSPAVQQVSQATPTNGKRARVAVVFTGGTISMTANDKGGPKPQLSGKQIMERVPEIATYLPDVQVDVHDFATLPGPHISPEMMANLSEFVKAIGEFNDGIVITHGTDTLEESAYFLDLTVGDNATVVFTGSMHASTDNAWDGPRNIIDAIAVAASKDFKKQGVLVCLDHTIHAASEVTKFDTMRDDTFRSHDFGPLGSVNILRSQPPLRTRSPHNRCTMKWNDDEELPHVELLKAYTGMDDRLFVTVLQSGASGVIVEAMGQGNVPPGAVNGIARACEMNVPVVITSRCQSGPVRPYYAYEGAGLELKRLGCLFAPYLTGPKARIKLMLALSAGYDCTKLEELFPCI
jgi:L-asparaginase